MPGGQCECLPISIYNLQLDLLHLSHPFEPVDNHIHQPGHSDSGNVKRHQGHDQGCRCPSLANIPGQCATTEKVCALIRRAGSQSAQIIGFPETFIPGYPGWVEVLPLHTEQAASLFLKLFNESVEVPGPETTAIGAACKEEIFAHLFKKYLA